MDSLIAILGSNIYFIPQPQASLYVQLWYVPIVTELLQDINRRCHLVSLRWSELVIVDAAIKALIKEESLDGAHKDRKRSKTCGEN